MGRKVKFGSRTYKQRAIQTARDFVPRMYRCLKCGSPVVVGYCCAYCGEDNSNNGNIDYALNLVDIIYTDKGICGRE